MQESDFPVVLPGRPVRRYAFDLVTDLVVGGEYCGACPDIEFLEVVWERNVLRVDRQAMDAGSIDIFKSRNLQGSAAQTVADQFPDCLLYTSDAADE